jgi:hypothetical protein
VSRGDRRWLLVGVGVWCSCVFARVGGRRALSCSGTLWLGADVFPPVLCCFLGCEFSGCPPPHHRVGFAGQDCARGWGCGSPKILTETYSRASRAPCKWGSTHTHTHTHTPRRFTLELCCAYKLPELLEFENVEFSPLHSDRMRNPVSRASAYGCFQWCETV